MEEHVRFTTLKEDFDEYTIENSLHLRLKPVVSDLIRKGDENKFALIFELVSRTTIPVKRDFSNVTRYHIEKELQFKPLKEVVNIYETDKIIILVFYQLEKVFMTNEKNNDGSPRLRMEGSTLVNIVQKPTRPARRLYEDTIDEDTIDGIWTNLMHHLCRRHRINVRNGYPTDYKIEDLRIDYYGAYQDAQYFRRHIAELAKRHPEIQVEGDTLRLTQYGVSQCGNYVRNWQRDF